jgi:hypothetical protein
VRERKKKKEKKGKKKKKSNIGCCFFSFIFYLSFFPRFQSPCGEEVMKELASTRGSGKDFLN